MALDSFNEFFNHSITDLLSKFPRDYKDKNGQPFWGGPKRAPNAIVFDADDENHMMYVLAYSNLIAVALQIPENRNRDAMKEILANTTAKAYVPGDTDDIKTPEEEKEAAANGGGGEQEEAKGSGQDGDDAQIAALLKTLAGLAGGVSKE